MNNYFLLKWGTKLYYETKVIVRKELPLFHETIAVFDTLEFLISTLKLINPKMGIRTKYYIISLLQPYEALVHQFNL